MLSALLVIAAAPLVFAQNVPATVNVSAVTSITSCAASPSVAGVNSQFLAQFPPLTGPAQIVSGDTTARSLYNQITSNSSWSTLLALAPKPYTRNVGATTTGYSASSDPDCWWTASGCTTPKSAVVPSDYKTCATPSTWGLTIDDGPSTEHCQLYQLLKDNNIEASLFYIGANVVQFPAAAAEGFKAGHTICVHTWSHNYTTTLTNEQVFAEMYYTQLAIKRVVGVTPRCFRPPYGDVDDRVRVFAYALGMDVWLWSGETNDWQSASGATASTINGNFNKLITAANDNSGVIVLTHETTLKIASFFVNKCVKAPVDTDAASFQKIAGAFDYIAGGHVCSNITHPYGESDAPVSPSFAQYIAGTRTTGNLVAVVNASAQVYIPNLGGAQPFANAAVVSPSASASASSSSGASTSASSSSATAAAASSTSTRFKMSTGTIAAIVGGCAAGIVALVLLALLILRRKSSTPAAAKTRIGSPQSADDEKSPYPSQKSEYGHLASQSDLAVNQLDYYSQPPPPVPPVPAHLEQSPSQTYRAW